MSRNLDEPGPDLYDEKYYINRELSWLEFNRRCLEQAEDASNPVLERVKFIAICCGNMDEFFMIRVPGIISKTPIPGPDYLGINRNLLLESISKTVQELVNRYAKCWDDIRQALADAGIRIAKVDDLVTDQMAWVSWFYRERIHPLLTPLALDVSHPFPFISNNSLNISVKLSDPKGQHYARVKVPVGVLPRFIEVPSSK